MNDDPETAERDDGVGTMADDRSDHGSESAGHNDEMEVSPPVRRDGQHERPTVLVPVAVLEGESISEGVYRLLANAHVVLLGYHVIPEQTAPGNARMQFEDRANRMLAQFVTAFEDEGATVDRRLVFTHDAQQTFDRLIHEHECLAALVPNPADEIESVLVAIRGAVGVGRISRLVIGLFAGTDVGVTLYHLRRKGESAEDAETLLEGVSDRLVDRGVDANTVVTRVEDATDPVDAITVAAEDHDAVIMGESDPSVATYVFGMPSRQIAKRFLGPVLVVHRELEER